MVPLASLSGMGLVQAMPTLPGAGAWAAWLTLLILALALVAWTCFSPRSGWLPWTLLAALAGFGLTAVRADLRMAEVLPAGLEGQVMRLTGRVASLPQRASGLGGIDGWRFVLDIDPAASEARAPPRVLLSCFQMPAMPRAGERWQLEAKLRRPHGLMNPHGFDQALWMLEQDLPAAGGCRAKGQRRLGEGAWSVDALRQSLRDAIDRRLGEAPNRRGAGVLAALSLGDQGAVMDYDK